MKITNITDLHCNAGWRNLSFLKIETDEGITGWSEFSQNNGSPGLSAVISRLGERLIGEDPRDVRRLAQFLRSITRQAPGGIAQQAVGALENALLDVAAKSMGVSVRRMLGGGMRTQVECYWTHCGTYRTSHADLLGVARLQSRDDLLALGREITSRGFSHAKFNLLVPSVDGYAVYMPGFPTSPGVDPALNVSSRTIEQIVESVSALCEGGGSGFRPMVDLNFNFRPEGFARLARALNDTCNLTWLEMDVFEPSILADIRRRSGATIASGESLYGIREYRPFLEQGAMDVAIVDIVWNGLLESLDIAAFADACHVQVAPHNFFGHLAAAISWTFSSIVPNLRIMEFEAEDVPWIDDLFIGRPSLERGVVTMPEAPGWGVDVNEEMLANYPVELGAKRSGPGVAT